MISKRENMLRLQPKSSATDGLNKCKMCLATLDRIATKCCSPTRRGSPPPTGLQHLVISYSLGLGAHASSAPLAYSRHPYFICTLGKWSDCDTKTNQFVETSGGEKIQPPLQVPEWRMNMLFFSHKASFLLTSKKHYNIFRSTGTNSSFGVVIRLHLQVL